MFTISQELGKILYVTSFHAKCPQVLIPLSLILWQNKYSLNVSQMNENWTQAGSRALSMEPAYLSQQLRYIQLKAPEWEDCVCVCVCGCVCVWFLSTIENSWGRENVFAELHYFLSHHLSLFSPPQVHVKGFNPEEVQILFWVTPGLYWKHCIFTVSHGM